MRSKLVAGNWKMYKTIPEAETLATQIADKVRDIVDKVNIAICPPFVALHSVGSILQRKKTKIILGAQNMHYQKEGAYTGEISAEMLLSAGVKIVIIGHSERRHIFKETDELINLKLKHALEAGLIPILCIGELIEERLADKTEQILEYQLANSLKDIMIDNPDKLVIAYEPVWAIGTGHNATPEQAQSAHMFVRQFVANLWGKHVAENIRILYGGSIKPENAKDLFSQPDVDGGLVGGASLSAESFEKIVRNAI